MADHGTLTKYRDGCRCDLCRGASAAATRRRRAANPGARARAHLPAAVVSLPAPKAAVPQFAPNGEVEAAVREQLAGMPKAVERSGEAAAATRLAQLLDDPSYFALAAQNSYKLHVILASLGTPKRKGHSRLAAIEQLTSRKRAAQ